MYKNLLKPILDFLFASITFILVLPLLIVIVVLLSIINKGKPFFFQKRPGKDQRPFIIIKFKTMNDDRDQDGNLLEDSLRLTRIGKFIRSTSLDEIPQLINVIKGDMSFVGPRPLLMEYLALYNDFQKQRHGVRPGITGWAQVNGRNALSWEKKFEHDVYYVKKISFVMDCKIILKTMRKVFMRSNINNAEDATMNRFKGNIYERN